MKTKITLFLLAISFSAVAQESKTDEIIPQFTHGIGVSMQKFDGLNNRLSKFTQYKKLDDYVGTLELGMLTEHNRVISDMNLTIGSSLSGHSKGGSVIRYLGVNIGIGYDVIPSKNVLLYPL